MQYNSCSECYSHNKSLYCELDAKNLSNVDDLKAILKYKNGDLLYSQGEDIKGVFCLKSGKVKTSIADSAGNEVIINILGPGAILGHLSLLTSSHYQSTAEFLEEGIACFIEKSRFITLVDKNPSLAINLGQRLANEVIDANSKNLSLVHHSVKERICALLLNLANEYGTTSSKGVEIDIKLTREEMASVIGTTPETVIRTLSQLKNEKIILLEGKKITIINKPQVESFVNFH